MCRFNCSIQLAFSIQSIPSIKSIRHFIEFIKYDDCDVLWFDRSGWSSIDRLATSSIWLVYFDGIEFCQLIVPCSSNCRHKPSTSDSRNSYSCAIIPRNNHVPIPINLRTTAGGFLPCSNTSRKIHPIDSCLWRLHLEIHPLLPWMRRNRHISHRIRRESPRPEDIWKIDQNNWLSASLTWHLTAVDGLESQRFRSFPNRTPPDAFRRVGFHLEHHLTLNAIRFAKWHRPLCSIMASRTYCCWNANRK